MAKINLTTQQHKQETLSALSSLGVLICMIVALVGIKLWWFKHRLSFEQKTSANSHSSGSNSAQAGPTSAVLVSRRSKQPKYKKDKRYSQQIYESVEVHGVFRQTREDDYEIQRPAQLPPVRIRQTSEGDSVLIRAPPRTKRSRDQVHSTAFEDVEIATPPPLTTASSSDLSLLPEINTKITLTFEEFERQFNLKEVNGTNPNNELNEKPKPPLRLNRSSTATTKPEKPERFLKSSQSITIPEFHKVIEKRSVGLASPKEDLTQIDYYEEIKIFDNFAQSKNLASAGYIKYEEVDNDLHDRAHNAEANKQDANFIDSGFYESSLTATALQMAHRNDLKESQSVYATQKFDSSGKSRRTNEWEQVDFKPPNGSFKSEETKQFEINEAIYIENRAEGSDKTTNLNHKLEGDLANFARKFATEFNSVEDEVSSGNNNNDFVNEPSPTEYNKECHDERKAELTEIPTSNETQNLAEIEIVTASNSVNKQETSADYDLKAPTIDAKKSQDFFPTSPTKTGCNDDAVSCLEDMDNQYNSWPQFEEKIETPQVTVRRFNNFNLKASNSFNENYDFETSSMNTDRAEVSLKARRPTGCEQYRPESPEFDDIEEWQEAFNNKFYNQVRSFITADRLTDTAACEEGFDSKALQQMKNKSTKSAAIRERRPTGYVKQNEYFLSSNDESDEDLNAPSLPKVKFENDNFEIEKFTLNQRRPTAFKRLSKADSLQEEVENQVTFDETTVYNDAETKENPFVEQRRPTGFIKKLEILELSSDSETGKVTQNSPTAKFMETAEHLAKQCSPEISPDTSFAILAGTDQIYQTKTEMSLNYQQRNKHFEVNKNKTRGQDVATVSPTTGLFETTSVASLVEQRRPTGYGHQEELFSLEKQVSFQFDIENNETSSQRNEALQQRRPTGFVSKAAISKHVNFQLRPNHQEEEKSEYGNEQLKQRRPTGFVSNRQELKCLTQPAPIYQPEFDDRLWQELEEEVAQDASHNFEAEFAKIRHSYELNEADFLEPKDELQKSPTQPRQQPLGFGKSIDDDWENFEKLQNQVIIKPAPTTPEEKIKITFSANELASNAATSILKDSKLEEEAQAKPRKSKVTFDFKTEERVIPARTNSNYSEEDTDFDEEVDDGYNKSPMRVPPQPLKRVSNINYNNETTFTPIVSKPTSIILFGSQKSAGEPQAADSWSALHKYRSVNNELCSFATDSSSPNLPASSLTMTPPKPAYRNPMAQLAIQRAKEVRADMDGFKSRSIKDRNPETASKKKQKLYNLSNVGHEAGTEA